MKFFSVAHTPDADDAFMFYALKEGIVKLFGAGFEHIISDIETLNNKALNGDYDITALSFHAYPFVCEKYALLDVGASFGDKYGPIIVSKENIRDLKGVKTAVPGKYTTAALLLKLYEPNAETINIPFDAIVDAVRKGAVQAGVLIHECQITYQKQGLVKLADLGEWWYEKTSLPVPLGAIAIKRDISSDIGQKLASAIRASVAYAIENPAKAMEYAKQFARGAETEDTKNFVQMYVNKWTLNYGEDGKQAVKTLYEMAHAKGLIPLLPTVDF